MNTELFFKHPLLPHIECRHSENSTRKYKLHMHKTFSIGAIEQGEVEYIINNKTGIMKKNELILINPETLHLCNPIESHSRNYYVLYLDKEWCFDLQQSLWNLKQFNPVTKYLIKDSVLYDAFINTMEILLYKNDLLIKEQVVIELIEKIFLKTCKINDLHEGVRVNIELAKAMLNSELSEDLVLKRIALKCKTNPFTLIKQFKTATGITPHAYRINVRIEYAKELLRKGLDISEIALECGFYDQSHFNHCFKAITAVTPREYMINFLQ